MSSADKQVIDMVNAPHERQEQLLAKSRAAKQARQLRVQKRAYISRAATALLRLAVALGLVVIVLILGFVNATG